MTSLSSFGAETSEYVLLRANGILRIGLAEIREREVTTLCAINSKNV
jgi:hypothetical protein